MYLVNDIKKKEIKGNLTFRIINVLGISWLDAPLFDAAVTDTNSVRRRLFEVHIDIDFLPHSKHIAALLQRPNIVHGKNRYLLL